MIESSISTDYTNWSSISLFEECLYRLKFEICFYLTPKLSKNNFFTTRQPSIVSLLSKMSSTELYPWCFVINGLQINGGLMYRKYTISMKFRYLCGLLKHEIY